MAINQHPYEDNGALQAEDIGHLATVVSRVEKTLFLLDEQGVALSRIWCLFEIFSSVKAKGGAQGVEIVAYRLPKLAPLFETLDIRRAQVRCEHVCGGGRVWSSQAHTWTLGITHNCCIWCLL